MSRQDGANFERQAERYLIAQGLRLVTRNFSAKVGEIDLIMLDGPVLVFVEVKARARLFFGGAVSAVTQKKIHNITQTAKLYLVKHKKYGKIACRFDVVCFNDGQPHWIKDAF